jgi:ABC-2 type transport system ATP-binding protein
VTVRSERETLAGQDGTLPGVQRHARKDGYDVYFTTPSARRSPRSCDALEEAGDPLVDLRVERPSLEERFLELTTHGGVA